MAWLESRDTFGGRMRSFLSVSCSRGGRASSRNIRKCAMDQSTKSNQAGATRVETDSFGGIEVPADRYWGAQTERSRTNFRIGQDRMPIEIVHALGIVKLAAAETNRELGLIDQRRAGAIIRAAREGIEGTLDDHFPLSG